MQCIVAESETWTAATVRVRVAHHFRQDLPPPNSGHNPTKNGLCVLKLGRRTIDLWMISRCRYDFVQYWRMYKLLASVLLHTRFTGSWTPGAVASDDVNNHSLSKKQRWKSGIAGEFYWDDGLEGKMYMEWRTSGNILYSIDCIYSETKAYA
jgi:hypothetical protein